MTDAMLCARSQAGDVRAADELVRRYEMLVAAVASDFYVRGADPDDVRQEGRIGLLKAIRLFDPARAIPFDAYARFAIRRQIITATIGAQRQKHLHLNESLRAVVNEDGERVEVIELVAAPNSDAHARLLERGEIRELGRKLRVALSPREAHCRILVANGVSYERIATLTGLQTAKDVNRALCRARWKLTGQGPPSKPEFSAEPKRTVYVCPGCGHETVRVGRSGVDRRGPGRPPLCNVCTLRKLAA